MVQIGKLPVRIILIFAFAVVHSHQSRATRPLSLLQHSHTTSARAPHPLNVAFAVVVPYGVLNSTQWRDGLAVMSRSAMEAAARSAHKTTLLALLPQSLPQQDEERHVLAVLGLTALFVPVPVPLQQVQNDFARKELALVLGEMEQLKYYGAALTEYDRVVILDGDTMFLSPIDELFSYQGHAKLLGIYDHELDIAGSAFPPLNTGFLVYTPDAKDFEGITEIYKKGDFREGTGWEGSHTGWTYGTGSQGILSFYYNQVQPGAQGYNPALPKKGKDLPGLPFTEQPASSRFLPLDRSVYDVIDTPLLREAVEGNHTNASRVKVFHFTGGCSKPWLCLLPASPLCAAMTERWWSFRAQIAQSWGKVSSRCSKGGKYEALALPE
mmetsp:Transcript_83838/g.195038  ORF Transcript_83838/g.195038 Transcript_83838/m.195038 type:complete len:382 (-) Transcript_83838:102-1247(-)